MATLTDLARLQAKLLELSLIVEDIMAREGAVTSPTAIHAPPPSPPSSPKPTPLLPPSHVLPLLTPVKSAPLEQHARPPEQSFDNVGSSPSISSAILRSENVTFRVTAAVAQSSSTPFPSSSPDTPPCGVASKTDRLAHAALNSPRRHLVFVTAELEQPLEPSASCCIDAGTPPAATCCWWSVEGPRRDAPNKRCHSPIIRAVADARVSK